MQKDTNGVFLEDFLEKSQLNFEGLIGFNKGYITEAQFRQQYANRAGVFSETQLAAAKDAIQKGGTVENVELYKGLTPVDVLRQTDSTVIRLWVTPEPKLQSIQKSEDKGEIEKSILSGYGEDAITFEKTGKEIKDKMTALKPKIEAQIVSLSSRMSAIEKEVGEAPTRKMGHWNYDPYAHTGKLPEMKLYSYGMCQYKKPDRDPVGMAADDQSLLKKKSDNCQEYNDCSYKLIEALKNVIELDVFIGNLDDKKKYTLSKRELLVLDS